MDMFSRNSHKHSKRYHHKRHKNRGSSEEETSRIRRNSNLSQGDTEDSLTASKSHRKHRRGSSKRKDRSSKEVHEKDSGLDINQTKQEDDGRGKEQLQAVSDGVTNDTTEIKSNTQLELNMGYGYTNTVEKTQRRSRVEQVETDKREDVQKIEGIVDIGTTVGTLQSTEVYLKTKEFEKYEKEKKLKKEKLRTEIEELRKQRDNMKVSLQMEQLKKEGDYLEKQKDLNQFEEDLLQRQEQLYERESEIKESLTQIEEAEGALERRQEIIQRKHEELTSLTLSQDNIGGLQQQLVERKEHLRRKSVDSSSVTQQTASLNWDFLRGVFHDKTALLTGALKACKAELAHSENELVDRVKEVQTAKSQVNSLQEVLKSKERKIKELEQHLTLTLQELKSTNKELKELKEPEEQSIKKNSKSFPKRPTRETLNGHTGTNNKIPHDSEKYVSQTCTVM